MCTSFQTDNHTSRPTSPLMFLQAGCPSCHPTSVPSTEDMNLMKLMSKEKHFWILAFNFLFFLYSKIRHHHNFFLHVFRSTTGVREYPTPTDQMKMPQPATAKHQSQAIIAIYSQKMYLSNRHKKRPKSTTNVSLVYKGHYSITHFCSPLTGGMVEVGTG